MKETLTEDTKGCRKPPKTSEIQNHGYISNLDRSPTETNQTNRNVTQMMESDLCLYTVYITKNI